MVGFICLGGRMHFCFSSFPSKRGRPKLEKSHFIETNKIKQKEVDVISSLFYLNKITKEQLISAHFYEQLYKDYQRSIESPIANSTSLIRVIDKNSSIRCHSREEDKFIHFQWSNLKKLLLNIKNCEEIIHKILIEQKLKDELLKPTRVNQNILELLKIALDKITEYRLDEENIFKTFEKLKSS